MAGKRKIGEGNAEFLKILLRTFDFIIENCKHTTSRKWTESARFLLITIWKCSFRLGMLVTATRV
jgi:hypothetical protein